ncbi:DNA cytosine methyltransferase [Brachyspira pilosicoli]|uniref:Cytosine-specific methyltransferase n=1 Tax=Brachyspira pilosicoli TaxID=52584 RepID=A0A5C8EXG3_BRAPL|nr:DNA cytosine methyltransferase [Brachyspira pilosicoli]TXJ42108.1 DNA cytosine methyltransferase [Brachyspira pilosicoli]
MIEIKEELLKNKTFIDLFAGLGGFRIALESLGAKCVYSNEWDKFAKEVYYNNFGDIPDDDITKVDERLIPDHDILCAGFPCQSFSISGKQKGFDDDRGNLFFDIIRIIKYKKSKIIFMENVKNLVSHNNGKTLLTIRNEIQKLGYNFYYKVLNATDYGIPQKRERIYIVCFRKDLNIKNFKFPEPIKLIKHLEDLLLDDNQIPNNFYVNRDDIIIKNIEDNQYSNKSIKLGIVNKGGQGERIYSTKGVAITLSAYGGGVFSKTGGYLIDGKCRKLVPRECARIMGYPDNFKIINNKNQAYKQFGNV